MGPADAHPASDPSGGACTVRRRAYLGMGSNLGDRLGYLREALAALDDVAAVSPVYETAPVGGPPQGPYLNVVVALDTARTPRQLLGECRRLEERAGRRRTVRFGPRTLDVDVLLVGDEQVDEPDLVVPHPRLWERRFVLAPLADLAPDLVPPGALAAAGGAVRRAGTLWAVDPIT
jgi:2-amino-4-hydroxy-6-hydroxymethyldihydropteridine diphosphokinase